jgi:hypothetical protein
MDFVLVSLKTNEPPAANTHYQESKTAPQYDASHEGCATSTRQGDEHATPSGHGQQNGEQ